jgi:hypothetical protein
MGRARQREVPADQAGLHSPTCLTRDAPSKALPSVVGLSAVRVFCTDGIQAAGMFPIDVKAAGVDAIAVGTYKCSPPRTAWPRTSGATCSSD